MANITINSTPTRVQYTATSGQTEFTYSFPIKDDTDLKVYQRGASDSPDDTADLLTITTEYTVSGANTANGGTVTLVTGATTGDIVTIVGDKDVDRTAIYDQSSTLKKADLNNDFNDNVMYDKQIETIQEQLTPKYARSELIGPSVREDNLILPILNDNYIWIGRGNYGDSPDDITTVAIGDYDALGLLSADFILGTALAALPNAQSLGGLGTGIVYNTDDGTTGTLSTLGVGSGLQISGGDLEVIADGGITVTQTGHGFSVGDWVYRDAGSNDYALAQADDATTTESIGVVAEVTDANNFVLQQSGYITGGTGNLSGLTDGTLYYLSDSVAGAMTSTEPSTAGLFSKPVFVATGTDSGWILSHRSLDAAAASASAVTMDINQSTHGFVVGDILKRNGGTNLYDKAQADSAANAESIGMVVDVIDVDNFTLQEIGYVTGLSSLTDGTVYFLDPGTAGAMTATEPSTSGQISKPIFVADSTTSGWLLHYRGMIVASGGGGAGSAASEIIIASHDFSAEANYDFDNILDGTYNIIEVYLIDILCTGATSIPYIQGGTGATPTYVTSNSYSFVTPYAINTDLVQGRQGTQTYVPISGNQSWNTQYGPYPGSGRLTLYNPNSSANKKITSSYSYFNSSSLSNMIISSLSGQINTTSALTSIRVGVASGTITSGRVVITGKTL